MSINDNTLEIKNLYFEWKEKKNFQLNLKDLKLKKRKKVLILGESGSGKSVSALSILSLLPNNADISGSIKLQGNELLGISHKELKSVRGSEVSFIFQEPMTSLNPLHTIEKQLREAVELHSAAYFSNISEYIVELLTRVGNGINNN